MISTLSRAFLAVCATWFSSAIFAVASAQSCYTVRDIQGKVVYQSLRPPVDISVPYDDEVAALFPGGYMQVDRNFFRCGAFEREIPVATATITPPKAKKGLFDDMPPMAPASRESPETTQSGKEMTVNPPPNLFENLAPKPAQAGESTPLETRRQLKAAPADAPRSIQVSGLGKFAAAAILVGTLCAPKKVRNMLLSVFAGLFVLLIGFVVYDVARPSTLPFAQCVIDNVPATRNDIAAYAAASQCVDQYGGYNSPEAKRYIKGQAAGFMTPKSRAECVTKHASNTTSEMAAKLVSGACSCLYQSATEGTNETSLTCG